MKGRAQTQPIVIPEKDSPQERAALIRINQNFSLLDMKIEKLWQKIAEMEEEEGE